MKEKIIEGASQLFLKYGVRSVTMDDIAEHLSMSKKTIYQFFKNKDELVTTVSEVHMDLEKRDYMEIEDDSENAIDEIAQVSKCLRKHLHEINPKLLFELKKYHPMAWNVYVDFKTKFVKDQIKKNINRGIAEGHYRKELNPEVLALFRIEQVEMIFDDTIYPKTAFDFTEVQMQLFDHFVHGLLTDKGRKLLHNYLQSQSKNSLV